VFEPFYRLDGSARGLTPGLGLGLALSRDLAQMNDGSLVLETSAPGRGSVFVLRLPPAP
jgi:signal transduction histidine kinase